jgi:hypothetical protein
VQDEPQVLDQTWTIRRQFNQSCELISFLMGRIVAGCNLFCPLRAVRGESAAAPRSDELSEDRGTHQRL